MNIKRICVLYFSPTGGTEKIARLAAGSLAQYTSLPFCRPCHPPKNVLYLGYPW